MFNAFGANLSPGDFPANSGRTQVFITTAAREMQYGGHDLQFPVGTTLTDLAGQVRIDPGAGNRVAFTRTETPNGVHVLGVSEEALTGKGGHSRWNRHRCCSRWSK